MIVAIVLSRLGKIGPAVWYMPVAANQVLRDFGLSVFGSDQVAPEGARPESTPLVLDRVTFVGAPRAKGAPVVLNVDQPTYADPQAAIAWSAGLQVGVHRADQLGLGTLIGRTTGEAFTLGFAGQGFVIVQPNSSKVLILFGRYTGTITEAGPHWVNPFTVIWRRVYAC